MSRVLCVSVTESGKSCAKQLPYEHTHGSAGDVVRECWDSLEGLVLMLSVGAAVRIISPLISSTPKTPAVVCVDEAGRWVIPILGGHRASANALAMEVASLLSAQAVITTASDSRSLPALDQLPAGWSSEGNIAAVMTALLNGSRVNVLNETSWKIPGPLGDLLTSQAAPVGEAGASGVTPVILVSDADNSRIPANSQRVILRPPSLVVGIGCSSDASSAEARCLIEQSLLEAGLSSHSIYQVATIDIRGNHEAVNGLGIPVTTFSSTELASVPVPNPSDQVRAAVGTPSVCEAAALLAAGEGSNLVSPKRSDRAVTVAIARRPKPAGKISLVGLGPGHPSHRTPAASAAVRSAEVIVGFRAYVEQCADLLTPNHRVIVSEIGAESERAETAVTQCRDGSQVAVVCSGDAGVYAMASLVCEIAEDGVDIRIIPGVTASIAAAAALGAPLGHDHASISLSDLLTPWETILTRLEAVAACDMVVSLYNPRSLKRDWQLDTARDIFLRHRPPQTPVGVVTDAARPSEKVTLTTLGTMESKEVSMTSMVIIGSSTTKVISGRMVTPRGYLHGLKK